MNARLQQNCLPKRKSLTSAVITCLLIGSGSVCAATYNVTNNHDSGAGSLRQAVLDANENQGMDTILFDPGLAAITLTTGQIDITESLRLNSLVTKQTINGNNNSRIFGVTTQGQNLTLENIALINGNTTGVGKPDDCTASSGQGGAVCLPSGFHTNALLQKNNGTLTLTNSSVTNSHTQSEHGEGGGISAPSIELVNSTVSENFTASINAGGGGISAVSVVLTDSTVSGNITIGQRSPGGGILTRSLIISNSSVAGNYTNGDRSSGGGIVSYTITMTNSTVSGNHTDGSEAQGGGIFASRIFASAGRLTALNSTVSENYTAGKKSPGGGISVINGDVQLHNSTITNNRISDATASAGGLYVFGYYVDISLTSSILAGNFGAENSIDNFVNGVENITIDPAIGTVDDFITLNFTHNILGDSSTNINGANNDNVFTNDPGLAILADTGCVQPVGVVDNAACVQTHALLPDSPALDVGSNPDLLATDQRGFSRATNGQVDIGAFKHQSTTIKPDPAIKGIQFQQTVDVNHLQQSHFFTTKNPQAINTLLFGYGPATTHGTQPGVVRFTKEGRVLGSPASADFDLFVRFQEFTYLDGFHVNEQIELMGFYQGVTTLADGTVMVAGSFTLSGNRRWDTTNFPQGFDGIPSVFLFAQTSQGGQPPILRARHVSADNFEAAIDEEENLTQTGHIPERIAYLAIFNPNAKGAININGKNVDFALQQVAVSNNWTSVFGRQIKLQEEQSRDLELFHVFEKVDVLSGQSGLN